MDQSARTVKQLPERLRTCVVFAAMSEVGRSSRRANGRRRRSVTAVFGVNRPLKRKGMVRQQTAKGD